MRCAPEERWCSRLYGEGAIHTGHFPAQLPWGHVKPVGPGARVAGPCLGRWGGTRATAPFTIDLDSTICDPTGWPWRALAIMVTRRPAGLSPAAGNVRWHRRRGWPVCARAGPTPLGAAAPHRSTGRRWGGCATPGPRDNSTMRADSGLYTHGVVSVCQQDKAVRFSITMSDQRCQPAQSHRGHTQTPHIPGCLDAHPLLDGLLHAPPMWPRSLTTPFGQQIALMPRRCGSSMGRVQPTPGSQLALFASYSYHGFITDSGRRQPLDLDSNTIAATPRSKTPSET